MKQVSRACLALLLGAGLIPAVQAAPVLTFEFIGSGQIVSLTDNVIIRGRLTNSGDLVATGIGGGSVTVPPTIFNQYIDLFPPGLSPSPAILIENFGSNESLEWTIAEYAPFPVGGAPGDPVQPGTYVFPSANIVSTILDFADFATYEADTSGAGDFVWTAVAQPQGVPEPSTLILLGLGGLALTIRRLGSGPISRA